MTRHPGRDEHGRPIVAELGRAETPEEMSARRAEASERYRGSMAPLALLGAIMASLAIVAFLVLVVVRPDATPSYGSVDYAARTAEAAEQTGAPFAAPSVPGTWYANRAGFGDDPGVTSWEIGFVTGENRLLTLVQGVDANPGWTAGLVQGASPGAVRRIGGLDWTSYDRRDADDPGLVAFALVTESGRSTIVISGTADDPQFEILAEAVARQVER